MSSVSQCNSEVLAVLILRILEGGDHEFGGEHQCDS